jgi:hypothetical protein
MRQKPLKKIHDVAEMMMSEGLYQAMDLDEDSDKFQYIEQNAKVAKTSEEDPRIEMRSTRENKSELSDE